MRAELQITLKYRTMLILNLCNTDNQKDGKNTPI